jgi:hypothetical protein
MSRIYYVVGVRSGRQGDFRTFSGNPVAEASSTIVSCLIGLTDDAAQPTGSRLHLVRGPNAIRLFVHAIDGTHAFFRMPRSRRSGW